jgi:Protein of unknown function (DUF664)
MPPARANVLPIDAPGYVPWCPRPNVKLSNIMVHIIGQTNRHAGQRGHAAPDAPMAIQVPTARGDRARRPAAVREEAAGHAQQSRPRAGRHQNGVWSSQWVSSA